MSLPLHVLILEDREADAELMVRELRQAGFSPDWYRVQSESEFLACLDPAPDLILADYTLPQFDALRALQLLQERGLEIPLIVITGSIGEELAVECVKQGAVDYLLKDRLARLGPAVGYALKQQHLRKEKRQAEEHIRLQGAVLEAAANAIVITDRDGRTAWVNPAFTRLTGYSFHEAWGENLRLLKSGKQDQSIYRNLWETVLAGNVWHGEMINRRKDGVLYTEEMTITPVLDERGEISHFIAIKQDITDRKRAEEALRSYVERLEILREIDLAILTAQSPQAIAETALRHLQRLVPSEAGSLALFDFADRTVTLLATTADGQPMAGMGTGLSLEEFGITDALREGRPDIVEDAQGLSQPLPLDLTLLAGGVRAHLRMPLVTQGELIGSLNLDSGAPGSFTPEHVEIVRDVADQLAIAIQQARLNATAVRRGEQLEGLLRATRSVMARLDLQGILDRIVAEAAQMAGTPHVSVMLADKGAQVIRVAALAGNPMPAAFAIPLGRDLAGIVAETGQPVYSADSPNDPRNLLAERDRDLGFVTYLGLPIKIRDEVIGVLTFDTTAPRVYTPTEVAYLESFADQAAIAIEHARLYEAIRQHAAELEQRVRKRTQELEAASRHKSEFLANMSHELRTPLNSIIGFSELLVEQRIGTLTERQARYVGHIHQSGKHLLHLINDVLDLSKVEAGKFTLQPELLSVASALEDILVIVRGLANRKQQVVEAEIAPDLPPLRADPVRFKQICFNLLGNAVKFTPEQGRIMLTARHVLWACEDKPAGTRADQPESPAPPSWIEVRVTDAGIGIKPEDLSRLFQEFVQLGTTQAEHQEGSGLGLALTKKLVEMHGGRIWAESEGEGRGSTFTFLLPLVSPGQTGGIPPTGGTTSSFSP